MPKENAFIAHTSKALVKDYGERTAGSILLRVGQLRAEYLTRVDDRGSPVVRTHITENILPVVSMLRAMEESGIAYIDAFRYVCLRLHEQTTAESVSMKRMSRIPFFFPLFRRISPSFMKKSFPAEGWDMRWKRCDKEEIAFDCHRCIYVEVTTLLGCPDLCCAFCENDYITYGALEPKVKFVRTKTLAEGGDCCDFRLLNGKKKHD